MLSLKTPALLRQQACFDGRWADADSGQRLAVHNPATGAHIADVPLMGAAETQRAIDAAQRAWPAWRRQTAAARGKLLMR